MNEPVPVKSPTPPGRPRRRKRIPKRLVVVSLILVVVLGGSYVYFAISGERDLQAAFAEADRLDPGWRLPELEGRRATVPDEQNSALKIQAMRALMPKRWPSQPLWDLMRDLDAIPPEAQLDEQQTRALRADRRLAEPFLLEARKLANYPKGRFAITLARNPYDTDFSFFEQAWDTAFALKLDVLWWAQENNPDRALTSYRAAFNAARSLGDEPILVAQFGRLVLSANDPALIERVLAQGEPSETALASTHRLLDEEDAYQSLFIGLRGERAVFDRFMEAVQAGELSVEDAINEGLKEKRLALGVVRRGDRIGDSSLADGIKAFHGRPATADWEISKISLLPGEIKRQRAAALRFRTQLVEIAKAPLDAQIRLAKELAATAEKLPLLSRCYLPAVDQIAPSSIRHHFRLRCASAAFAAERYRRAHRRWPASLDDLVPAYLRRVPTDPHDGMPLRFERLDDGLVIYSISPSGDVPGAKTIPARPVPFRTDLCFRLWDVKRRRQPPRPAVVPKRELP